MRKSSNRLKPAKCTCWIPTKSLLPKPPSSARQHWPKNMDYAEFDALTRGWRSLRQNNNPGPRIRAGTDASAIHRRLGAQVALLQSPILPAAYLPCIERRRTFRGLPVDKPHTRNSRITGRRVCPRITQMCANFSALPSNGIHRNSNEGTAAVCQAGMSRASLPRL